MSDRSQHQLGAHLRRHARRLHRIACGFGRERDADDVIQILYARWWRRMRAEPDWAPPEDGGELFVCVKRVVIDEIAKEKRLRLRDESAGRRGRLLPGSPEESLHAFERLRWILARLPAPLAEALTASLSAGRRNDAAVARELGISHGAYTLRLFRARRAAEELATYFEVLTGEQAELMARVSFGDKTRAEIAGELRLREAELELRWQEAVDLLERHRTAAAL